MTEQSLAIISCVLAIVVFNLLVDKRLARNIFAFILALGLFYGELL